MLLAAVDYYRPDTVQEATQALADNDDARALAGGQSLISLLKLRATVVGSNQLRLTAIRTANRFVLIVLLLSRLVAISFESVALAGNNPHQIRNGSVTNR